MIAEAVDAFERVFVALMLLAGLVGGLCGLLLVGLFAAIRCVWVTTRGRRDEAQRGPGAPHGDSGPPGSTEPVIGAAEARVRRRPAWAHEQPLDCEEAA